MIYKIEQHMAPFFKTNMGTFFSNLNARTKKSREFLQTSIKISRNDFFEGAKDLIKNPNSTNTIKLIKDSVGSSAWIFNSYLNYLKTMAGRTRKTGLEISDEDSKFIIEKISKNIKIEESQYSEQEIFQAIYNELYYSFQNPNYKCPLSTPKIFPTIVLISGVLNEIYATAAFERGVSHLKETTGLRYFVADTHGFKSTQHNIELIEEQLFKYVENNPDEKLWIIAYSKGGIDTLHFLKANKEWGEKNVAGFSTIASPILGSQHLDHKVLQTINKLHVLEETKIYQFINEHFDILAKDFQNSMSHRHQKPWFQNNYHLLPGNMFYTSLALEAEWFESHIYMILAKMIFPSKSVNDGVVDAENAKFPDYFKAINLGIIRGHHLIGARSSTYSQEALITAHVIFLKYMNLV